MPKTVFWTKPCYLQHVFRVLRMFIRLLIEKTMCSFYSLILILISRKSLLCLFVACCHYGTLDHIARIC